MKKLRFTAVILIAAVFTFTACDDDVSYVDTTPPAPPVNVETFGDDGAVEITWSHNTERDLDGYNVYYSTDYWGKYEFLGFTENNWFVDHEAVNGEKYFYGVAAVDFDGNESELSYDEVYGIARPQGLNRVVYDYLDFPDLAGFSFADNKVYPYDDYATDFFFEYYPQERKFFIDVWEEFDIQDMGPTTDIYDINVAPSEGWIPLNEGDNIKYVEAIPGHTYVIWTVDNHFAKIRINSITNEKMVFDWAYQMVEGERMLKRNSGERKSHKGEKVKIEQR